MCDEKEHVTEGKKFFIFFEKNFSDFIYCGKNESFSIGKLFYFLCVLCWHV